MVEKQFRIVVAVLSVIVSLGATQAALAMDDASMPHHVDGSAHHDGTVTPEGAKAVWSAVRGKEADLGDLIKSKKLDTVHETAFSIRDLVATLPAKSTGLTTEQIAKLNQQVKFVAALAGRLDEAGDKGDQAATEENFRKLQSVLDSIEKLYPGQTVK